MQTGRRVEDRGAHTYGHNRTSIGIVIIGGLDSEGKPKDTRTPEQKAALKELCKALQHDFTSQSFI